MARKKRWEVNAQTQVQAELSSNVVVWLKVKSFGLCLPKTIPENLDLSIWCFCGGQNLVLQEQQGYSPSGTLQHSQNGERWGGSFLKQLLNASSCNLIRDEHN